MTWRVRCPETAVRSHAIPAQLEVDRDRDHQGGDENDRDKGLPHAETLARALANAPRPQRWLTEAPRIRPRDSQCSPWCGGPQDGTTIATGVLRHPPAVSLSVREATTRGRLGGSRASIGKSVGEAPHTSCILGWPLASVQKACASMEADTGTDSRESKGAGTCPRCGHTVFQTGRGRPRTWCSQACRRAAYEERRAAAAGAIGVELVHRTIVEEHPLSVCVDRTIASPVGCRRVLAELAQLLFAGTLGSDPKWSSVHGALTGLSKATRPPARHRWVADQ